MGEGAEFQDTGYFLTSYAEFDYARRAIQLESVEYLLKPIDFEKLEEALKKQNRQCFRKTYRKTYRSE